jgi:hypothetical protein
MADGTGITIRRKATVRVLAIIALILFIAHGAAGALDAGKDLFHLGREQTIPTLYSSLLMLGAAVLLASIGQAARTRDRGHHLHWYGLAVVFTFLAIDESVGIHELTIEPLRDAFNASGLLYYTWVVPYVAALVVLVVVYARFLLDLPDKTRYGFLIAGAVYVLGAVVVESFTGLVAEGKEDAERGALFRVLQGTEEVLEIVGLIIFINVLLAYIEEHVGTVAIRIGDEAS